MIGYILLCRSAEAHSRSAHRIFPYEGIIYDAYLQELNGVMLIAVIFASSHLLLPSVILILQCLSGMLQETTV